MVDDILDMIKKYEIMITTLKSLLLKILFNKAWFKTSQRLIEGNIYRQKQASPIGVGGGYYPPYPP